VTGWAAIWPPPLHWTANPTNCTATSQTAWPTQRVLKIAGQHKGVNLAKRCWPRAKLPMTERLGNVFRWCMRVVLARAEQDRTHPPQATTAPHVQGASAHRRRGSVDSEANQFCVPHLVAREFASLFLERTLPCQSISLFKADDKKKGKRTRVQRALLKPSAGSGFP